jgi:hypothetical protein
MLFSKGTGNDIALVEVLENRDAHRDRTSRAGRFRTTVAVPVPFRACVKYLDGRWTGRTRTVHARPQYVRHGRQDGLTGIPDRHPES